MDVQIKISVIVPIYGVEKYIGQCVKSLMEQTLDNIEYIFVDDCTTDASVSIAKGIINQYPERKQLTKWVHHSQNRGLTKARNSGLEIAKGEYIYHCDSDDRLDIQMLEKLYSKAKSENLDLVWCDFYSELPDDTIIEKTVSYKQNKTDQLRKYMTYGWNVVWNTICKKEIYTRDAIKSLETISFCEDFELMSRLLMSCDSWGKVEEPLYFYNRKNIDSMVSKSLKPEKLLRTIDNAVMAVTSVCDFARNRNPEIYKQLKQELNWRMLKAKTYLFFFPSKRNLYLSIMPECHKDIDSNPLCSKVQKSMQRMILSPMTTPLVWLFGLVFRFKACLK